MSHSGRSRTGFQPVPSAAEAFHLSNRAQCLHSTSRSLPVHRGQAGKPVPLRDSVRWRLEALYPLAQLRDGALESPLGFFEIPDSLVELGVRKTNHRLRF
jgi:hypothetical protein